MKKIILTLTCLATLFLSSCGEKREIAQNDIDISGYIDIEGVDEEFNSEDCFKVASGIFTFYEEDGKVCIDVPIIKSTLIPPMKVVNCDRTYLRMRDANRDYLEDTYGNEIKLIPENIEELNTLLCSELGETTKIKFAYYMGNLNPEELFIRISNFKIRIRIEAQMVRDTKSEFQGLRDVMTDSEEMVKEKINEIEQNAETHLQELQEEVQDATLNKAMEINKKTMDMAKELSKDAADANIEEAIEMNKKAMDAAQELMDMANSF